MTIFKSPEGSLWRRWDLHLHTPDTRLSNSFTEAGSDAAWDNYIDALEASPVQAFGITEYFGYEPYFKLIEKYRSRYPNSKKAFFPNIELRLSESISATGKNPHIHVIFDRDPDTCGKEVLKRFCTHLRTQAADDSDVRLKCIDLKTTANLEAATVSLDDLLEALEQTFGSSKPYLLVFPANNDGLRSTDTGSPRKVLLADRIDRNCHAFFGAAGNREFFLKKDRYKEGTSEPKPVVSGSDAHSFQDLERLSGDVSGYPPTWIKADLTFRGLQQICFEPEDRVFIGAQPAVLDRLTSDGTKFLKDVAIDKARTYDDRNGKWFKNVSIPLNPELTAIIGNKGSCKSAIVDILGLLGDSRQEQYFSFLADGTKNKKFRQAGYSENFDARITWVSGKTSSKNLSDRVDLTQPETIRYLPQNYFEQLTNELEIAKFRKEIEEVVFSHVDESDRLGKASFSDLEDFTTAQSKQEISTLKRRLRELNLEIVKLEEQGSAQYRKRLEGQRKAKADELAANESSKPSEVAKPDQQTPEQLELTVALNEQTALLTSLKEREQLVFDSTTKLKSVLQSTVTLHQKLVTLKGDLERTIEELRPSLHEVGIAIEDVVKFEIAPHIVSREIEVTRAKIAALEANNDRDFSEEIDFTTLDTIPDLRSAHAHVSEIVEALKEKLGTPQRQFQAYSERLDDWRRRREEILGAEVNPGPDTLRGIEAGLKYLDEELPSILSDKRGQRRALAKSIYATKRKVLKFYSDLKQSVDTKLSSVRTEGFLIEIDAAFVADRDFRRKFFDHINRRRKGPFRDADAEKDLAKSITETNLNDVDKVLDFAQGLIEKMRTLNGEQLEIGDQVRDVKELYDFLFSLDYFDAKYELRLSGKNLNELSPGEKGLLLLVFYLQLDKKNTPLVIDQPEDNLDNDSIFQVLAKCIRQAKKGRQVVMVTHNPNLAVGADAEEIVYVRLDKSNQYKFSWESGAIENPAMNQRIVDILEGSQPAFVKRRLKYGI